MSESINKLIIYFPCISTNEIMETVNNGGMNGHVTKQSKAESIT